MCACAPVARGGLLVFCNLCRVQGHYGPVHSSALTLLRCAFACTWLTAASCSFEVSFADTQYQCGPGGECPTDYVCSRGTCVTSPGGDVATRPDADVVVDRGADGRVASPDGGAPPDARTQSDPDPPADAAAPDASADPGPVVLFADRFDDSGLGGWQGWVHPGCTAAESGGVLELSYNASSNAYCGADTTRAFDLRGRGVTVEVVAAPAINGFESYLILFEGQQQIHMIRHAGGMTLRFRRDGAEVHARSIALDATAQRFWRIREQAGTVHWDTSGDGTDWVNRHSAPAAIDVSRLQVELAAGRYTGTTTPISVRFDNLVVQ